MFTDKRANVWSVILIISYVVVSVVMWVVACYITDDKSRAAMIGAASAFTVGGAAVAGGWFTAWRTSHLQQAREDRATLREMSVRLLASITDYESACSDEQGYRDQAGDADSDVDVLNRLILAAMHKREDVRRTLLRDHAAVELVAPLGVQEALRQILVLVKDEKVGKNNIKQEERKRWMDDLAEAAETFTQQCREGLGAVGTRRGVAGAGQGSDAGPGRVSHETLAPG